jgi:2,3-bisphosphoglycerate-dependent phosphoglycerate mutase
MSQLILVRHGQSEWNQQNLFTGWRDPDLTERGVREARNAGRALKAEGIKLTIAFTSELMRAQKTCALLLEEQGQSDLQTIRNVALNERDYGDLSGLNKDDAREKWGEEQVHIWRRSFDTPPPGGESLKDTAERVLPYFNNTIMPRIRAGENVLVAAHGNSLRALVMVLDGLGETEITQVNIATGEPYIYDMGAQGGVVGKRILPANNQVG